MGVVAPGEKKIGHYKLVYSSRHFSVWLEFCCV